MDFHSNYHTVHEIDTIKAEISHGNPAPPSVHIQRYSSSTWGYRDVI